MAHQGMRHGRLWSMAIAGLVCAVSGMISLAEETPPPPAPAEKPSAEFTDAKVVASMRKGIDFLLSTRKTDNWEITYTDKRFFGGETAIALYALLHAGESLQDDPE